jgi:hypothetical protein
VLEWVEPLMGCGNWAPELIDTAEILGSILQGRPDTRYSHGWRWLADLTPTG